MASVRPLWDSDFSHVVTPLLKKAQFFIYLTSFKMEPKGTPRARRLDELISLLVAAKARGVDVRILLNFQNNKQGTSGINWYAAKVLFKKGLEVKHVPGGRTFHAKVLTIDHDYCIVGSHNWSILSHDRNIELSVLMESKEVTRKIVEDLDRFWERALGFPGAK